MGIQDRDWYHERRDGLLANGPIKPPVAGSSIFKVSIAIFVGALVSTLLIGIYQARNQAEVINAFPVLMKAADADGERMTQRMLQEAQSRESAQQQIIRHGEVMRVVAIRERERREEVRRQEERAELIRKERAWARYYKAPSQCDSGLPNIDMVKCANDFIRARRALEAATDRPILGEVEA